MERKSKIDLIATDEFKQLVMTSPSIGVVLEGIGYMNKSGTAYNKVKERIKKEGLSVFHMERLISKNSKNSITKTPLKDILVVNSTYKNLSRLKIRLINEGIIKYKCGIVNCTNNGMWLDKPISLQLDHINGINNDNRLENLRLLCPNCHSQTETYGGRNQGNYN